MTGSRTVLALLLVSCARSAGDTCARVDDGCRLVAKANDFNADGVPENRSTWTYDDDGHPLVYELFDGNDTLTWRTVSTWDGDLEVTHDEDHGGDGVIDTSTTTTREPLADGGYRDTYVTTSTVQAATSGWTEYDALGHAQRSEITTEQPDGPWTFSRQWTWDDQGHLTVFLEQVPAPDRSVVQLFSYDDDGRLLSSETRYTNEDTPYRRLTTAWDGCNPVETVEFTDPDPGEPNTRTCAMTFDRQGQQTSKTCFNEGDPTPLVFQTWTWSDPLHHQIAYDSDNDLQPD